MGLLKKLISPPFTDGENHIPDDVPQKGLTYEDYNKIYVSNSDSYELCPNCGQPGVKSQYKSGGPCIKCGSSAFLK